MDKRQKQFAIEFESHGHEKKKYEVMLQTVNLPLHPCLYVVLSVGEYPS